LSDKTSHVLERLPDHRCALLQRMMRDPEFRCLCEDFGEALEALHRWEHSPDQHRAARVEEFSQLLAELESEILVELGIK
jgi:cell division FtsZ-interacting protein ZapD